MAQARVTDILSLRKTGRQPPEIPFEVLAEVGGSETKQSNNCKAVNNTPKRRQKRSGNVQSKDERIEDDEPDTSGDFLELDGMSTDNHSCTAEERDQSTDEKVCCEGEEEGVEFNKMYKLNIEAFKKSGLEIDQDNDLLDNMTNLISGLQTWQRDRQINLAKLEETELQELEVLSSRLSHLAEIDNTINLSKSEDLRTSLHWENEAEKFRGLSEEMEVSNRTFQVLRDKLAQSMEKHETKSDDREERRRMLELQTEYDIALGLAGQSFDVESNSMEEFEEVNQLEDQLNAYTRELDALLSHLQ